MKKSELLEAINCVVEDLQGMTDSAIKKKYKESQEGLIGLAIGQLEGFLIHQISSFDGEFKVSTSEDMQHLVEALRDIDRVFILRCTKLISSVANDESFLMAA